MNFREFFDRFPDEQTCQTHFKTYRDKVGVKCKGCGGLEHYWLSKRSYYQCKKCGFRTSLKAGTLLENSKLPYMYWYMIFGFMGSSKKSFSALELQRQIGHKFYQPVWEAMHKTRIVMGKRDAEYKLRDAIEMDEGFFVSVPEREKDEFGNKLPKEKMKPGKGSPRNQQVLVMTESKPNPDNKNIHRTSRSIRHIKMICIPDNKMTTIDHEAKQNIDSSASIITDGANHYNNLRLAFKNHESIKMTFEEPGKVLPWVHKTISNSKRNLVGVHHSIGKPYVQNYLNEFAFKFNRRYNGIDVFDRLVNAAVRYQWDE